VPDADADELRCDVRRARCTLREDKERLLAAAETCGGGFDDLNA
jgi:hypothetical protein